MIKKIFIVIAAVFIMTGSMAAAPIHTTQQDEDFATHREIRKKLVTLPFYGIFDNLSYKLEGDTVVLYGQTVRSSTRKDAERRIRKIEGIDRVVNNIEVLPFSRFDDRIRVNAFRTIFRTGNLSRYAQGVNPSVHLIVKNGHLTLEGIVATEGDSRLFYIAARGVPDVFSVTNNLRIEDRY